MNAPSKYLWSVLLGAFKYVFGVCIWTLVCGVLLYGCIRFLCCAVHLCAYTITIWFSCSRYIYDPFKNQPYFSVFRIFSSFSPSLSLFLSLFFHIHLRQMNTSFFSFRFCRFHLTHTLYLFTFLLLFFFVSLFFGSGGQSDVANKMWTFGFSFPISLFNFVLRNSFALRLVQFLLGFRSQFARSSLVWLFTVNFMFRVHFWKLFFMLCA